MNTDAQPVAETVAKKFTQETGVAVEFITGGTIDRLNKAGLFTEIEDETPASQGLLRALHAGRPAATVPQWAYRQSNVATAIEHFLIRVRAIDLVSLANLARFSLSLLINCVVNFCVDFIADVDQYGCEELKTVAVAYRV